MNSTMTLLSYQAYSENTAKYFLCARKKCPPEVYLYESEFVISIIIIFSANNGLNLDYTVVSGGGNLKTPWKSHP